MSATVVAPGTDAPASREPIPASVWRITAVVIVGAVMAGLDTSLVNVGLDTIAHDLSASLIDAQWITSGYLLALAATLPLCGWLTRRFGASRTWLVAIGAFTAASALCAAAPALPILLIARVLQGAAAGVLVPTGQSVMARAAGRATLSRLSSAAGLALVVAPAIGPGLGGLLIAHASWQWLFLVNVPIGLAAVIAGIRILPRDRGDRTARVDTVGAVLLAAGLPLLSWALITVDAEHAVHLLPGAAGLAGIVAVMAFAVGALRSRSSDRPTPVLNLHLFRDRVYAAAQAALTLSGVSLYGGLVVLPLYFEVLRHQSALQTGALLLVYGAGTAVAMFLSGRIAGRIGGGWTAAFGLAITVLATAPMAALPGDVPLGAVEVLTLLRGLGVGLVGAPLLTSVFQAVGREDMTDAASTTNIVQRLGGSLGSGIFVILLGSTTHPDAGAFHLVFACMTGVAALGLAAALLVGMFQQRTLNPSAEEQRP
jgi:EmrB/QacA subfamily drug resistance transporter